MILGVLGIVLQGVYTFFFGIDVVVMSVLGAYNLIYIMIQRYILKKAQKFTYTCQKNILTSLGILILLISCPFGYYVINLNPLPDVGGYLGILFGIYFLQMIMSFSKAIEGFKKIMLKRMKGTKFEAILKDPDY
jgi:hypothetical protein